MMLTSACNRAVQIRNEASDPSGKSTPIKSLSMIARPAHSQGLRPFLRDGSSKIGGRRSLHGIRNREGYEVWTLVPSKRCLIFFFFFFFFFFFYWRIAG